jgi:L-serine/L-threonine ammonia-lyase
MILPISFTSFITFIASRQLPAAHVTSQTSHFSCSSITDTMDETSAMVPGSDATRVRLHDLYIATPLIKSEPLTKLLRTTTPRDVYIKLDNLQRSGSYKDRGMAHLLYQKRFVSPTDDTIKGITSIVCSSGGNAGLAAATVARDLQLPCTVVVPITTKSIVVDKLKGLNATVIVTGSNWNEADKVAQKIIQDDIHNTTLYVPPYDHPLLWTGISSIVDEIYSVDQISPPGTIILSVGGGGLLCGILEGLQKVHENDVKIPMPHIICSETDGAASFHASYTAKTIVQLSEITSIATSLGALSVTSHALQRATEYPGTLSSSLCSDAEAVQACLNVSIVVHFAADTPSTIL